METYLTATIAVTFAAFAFYWWVQRGIVEQPMMSGDKWYMMQMAFTSNPVSPPYCWRPLLPMLARVAGFAPVSFLATLATPPLIYEFAGGGLPGLCCALIFIGNPHVMPFNIRNPEYVEGLGHFLFVASLLAMSVGSPLVWPLLLLSALCRETLTAALGAICLFWNPWYLIPLMVGAAASYLLRRESRDNRHPLVEETAYATVVRWAREKRLAAFGYAHVIQPLRGTPLAVPFVWGQADAFARIGLVGLLPIWLLALPASGQSRIVNYGFVLLVPFVAACPTWAQLCFVFAAWFIPGEIRAYNESGSESFGFAR